MACRKPAWREVDGAAVSFRSEIARNYPDFRRKNKLRLSIDACRLRARLAPVVQLPVCWHIARHLIVLPGLSRVLLTISAPL
ncbi:hypothetical protein MARHY3233 [Marinobacter nauticus ATCC 49840]|nr:hypothetical protein MARHY3233 [Marinobacter nauticus ATCC 49840]